MGRMLLFMLATFAWLARPPLRPFQILKQLHFIGFKSTFVVVLSLLGANAGSYWSSIESAVEWKDVYGGIVKSISFGLIVSWVCCYKGYFTRMSAEGLGTATTEAVVLSSVVILVWDYFLTSVLL